MMAATNNKVKSLSDLGKLVRDVEQETGTKVVKNTIEDLRQAILSIITPGTSCTMSEVICRLADKEGVPIDECSFDSDEVSLLIINMRNAGVLIETRAHSRQNTYTRKVTMPSAQIKEITQVKTPIFSDAKVKDPASTIQLSDGHDLAIWKALADYKKRNVTEIASILGQFGFRENLVKDRVIALMRRGWLDRTPGAGKLVRYSLRKGISCPKPNGNVDNSAEWKADFKEDELNILPAETTTKVQLNRPPSLSHGVPANVIVKKLDKAPAAEPAKIDPTKVSPPTVEDGSYLAIWKVLCDYKPYTSADIILLLSDVGYPGSSISGRLSDAVAKGWVLVSGEPGKRYYTLREGTPAPEAKPYVARPRAAKEETKSTDNVSNLRLTDGVLSKDTTNPNSVNDLFSTTIQNQTEPENHLLQNTKLPAGTTVNQMAEIGITPNDLRTAQNTATIRPFTVAPVAPVVPAASESKVADVPAETTSSMVQASIKIRGMNFTFKEVTTLLDQLSSVRKLNFTSDLVEQRIFIKGVWFAEAELETLSNELKALGF
jgi:hypothetical protein